ncbi:MAG TPA: hypothetical protein VMF30_14785, partial [Pirellulales bacterium]|nr:hypothetical protein [Pirellulales bacterium]
GGGPLPEGAEESVRRLVESVRRIGVPAELAKKEIGISLALRMFGALEKPDPVQFERALAAVNALKVEIGR